jgi:predicted outer membrane protein
MRFALPLVALILAGCANPAQEAPYTTTPIAEKAAGGFECSAEAAQYAIGQNTSVELAAELMKKTGSKTLRWMPPRTAATMDFRNDRLNIAYDDAMVITQISCG